MATKPNGQPEQTQDADPTENALTTALQGAMGVLESKLMEYLETNVAPLVERIQQLEGRVSAPSTTEGTNTPKEGGGTLEARLAQLEKEKAEAKAKEAAKEAEMRLRTAITGVLDKTPNIEDKEFLAESLYLQLVNQAEDTKSGWLLKGTGQKPEEFVSEFLTKDTGKRFIKVSTAPGGGTPQPKGVQPAPSTPESVSGIISQVSW